MAEQHAFTRGLVRRALASWAAFAGLLLVVLLDPSAAWAQARPARHALVIGNAAYQGEKTLKNPVNDANDMASVLQGLGFTVHRHANLGRQQMNAAIDAFYRAAQGAELAVVYYSGHGMQAAGETFLIPVDARIASERDVRSEGVRLGEFMDDLQARAIQKTVLILDACRDNPFRAGTRSGTRGLARPKEMDGAFLVAYSTSDGSTADDGDGRNGVYTAELLRNLRLAGTRNVRDLLEDTQLGVERSTQGKQRPKIYGDTARFREVALATSARLASNSGPAARTSADMEREAWDSVRQASNAAAFEAFVREYPDSAYAPQARIRIAALQPSPSAPGVPAPSFGRRGTREVVIGHVGPLTGPQAHYGRDNENGVRLAIDDLNARNLTIGGQQVTFRLQGEDDAADPRQGTAAAMKLCEAHVNGVVGHLNSGTSIPASKIYEGCGVPQITPSATNPRLTRMGLGTAYRVIADDDDLGAMLAKYAVQTLGVRRVAVIDDRTAYGSGVAEAFRATAERLGAQVVDREFVNDRTTDFSAILPAVRAKSPDAIFYGGMDAQAGPLLRQMGQLGMSNVKVFGGDGICLNELANLAAGSAALSNTYCAEGGVRLSQLGGFPSWKARYDARFPNQFQVYSPYSYDAVFALVEAMKAADSTDPRVYGPKLKEIQLRGVTGTIAFNQRGDLREPTGTVYRFSGGRKSAIADLSGR